jgi:hypothetical protein
MFLGNELFTDLSIKLQYLMQSTNLSEIVNFEDQLNSLQNEHCALNSLLLQRRQYICESVGQTRKLTTNKIININRIIIPIIQQYFFFITLI